MAALGSEDWRNAIHAGVFSDGADRPSVPELPLLRETPPVLKFERGFWILW